MANLKDKQEQSDVEVPAPKMKRKEYEKQMRLLHGELVAMQEWVKESGAKICVVFEGRDTAGKVPCKPLALPRHHPAQTATGGRLRAAGPATLRNIPTPF